MQIHWISISDPPEAFPPVVQALRQPDGLLAAGGDLNPLRILAAYRRGIFPWYEAGQPILWWSPDPRAVLFPDEVRISRSLRRTLRRNAWEFSFDSAFADVVAGCAGPRAYADATWITPEMASAYQALHHLGWAHSIEIWQDDELVGGLYGLAIGGVFFGESMFSLVSDASKVALLQLMASLPERSIRLVDCQVASPHLSSLGSRSIDRHAFIRLLDRYCGDRGTPMPWTSPRREIGLNQLD